MASVNGEALRISCLWDDRGDIRASHVITDQPRAVHRQPLKLKSIISK